MHDLESFFWVLFWICIHYNGPGEGRVVESFEAWHFKDVKDLAIVKQGMVSNEDMFWETMEGFTEYYKPLAPWMDRLRVVVFPNGQKWRTENKELYSLMMGILCEARRDMAALEEDSDAQA